MELRSRKEASLQKGQATLGFRTVKKAHQVLDKDLPSGSKTRRFSAGTSNEVPPSWPPVCDTHESDHAGRKLPEKLHLLEDMYYSMEAAISLLNIRRDICTFSKVSAAVESSTHRRFLRSHLAQIKYILQEAMQVEEYMSWNVETQTSQRDLRIKMHPVLRNNNDASQRSKSPHKHAEMLIRRQEFHRRLSDFYLANQEGNVPEAPLFGEEEISIRLKPEAKLEPRSHVHLSVALSEITDNEKAVLSEMSPMGKVLEDDNEGAPNIDGCEPVTLPVAFEMSQLKKFPRSPSKLRHQQRVSPVPQYSSLFHLPPPFKPYFSARKRISIETDNSDKMTEVRSGSSLSIIDVKPHFSLKKCKGIASNVAPATPSKLFLRNIECEETSSSESPLSQYQAVTAPGPALTSPLSSPLPNSSTTMPEQSRTPVPDERLASPCVTLASTPAARLASPSVTLASTPDQAVFTPAAHATPTITVKGAENRSARHRKQAIIKSLRFGTPTKHVVLEQTPTPLNALTDAISSPLKTPVKRSGPNVNRALLFSSPIRKSKGRPVFEDDGGAVCKRPRQCSPPEATVPVPVEVMNQAENSGPRDMKGCTEDFVDLTSISGADKLSASDMEVLKCLPQELLNDVQAKERRLLEDQRLGVEKARRRQQLVAGLPKLFNNVRLIFQSESRTVIACRDLTKMVLSSLPDVTDQSEVVEQLGLLVELAPEWISVNQSLTGDSIYRINKNANMRAISKALIDAK